MSLSHPCLSHHHLYLHHLREQAIQTEYDQGPASAPAHGPSAPFNTDLDTIAERTFRSQACSPTSTWLSDEGDDLDSVATESVVTATVAMESVFTDSVATASMPSTGAALQSTTFPSAVVESADNVSVPIKSTVMENVVAHQPPSLSSVADVSANKASDSVESIVTGNVAAESLSAATIATPTDSTVAPVIVGAQLNSPTSAPCVMQEAPLWEDKGEPTTQTSQPRSTASQGEQTSISGVTVVEMGEENEDEQVEEDTADDSRSSGCGVPIKSYWSRHFLVDLLAVAVPVVPTVAWLCRGPRQGGQPMYHIGALLRGCCTVALHSLRRGGGMRHYPAGGGGAGGMSI